MPFALAVAALDDHVSTLHPRRVETLGPELGAILPAAANGHAPHPPTAAAAPERFRYHRALRSLLELLTRERPLALLLDDLHWADDASIEFIQHLLRRPPRSPYLLILALRAPSVLLETAVPRNGTEYVYLDPLDHERVAGAPAPGPRRRAARADRARGARQPVLPGPAHAGRRGHAAAVRPGGDQRRAGLAAARRAGAARGRRRGRRSVRPRAGRDRRRTGAMWPDRSTNWRPPGSSRPPATAAASRSATRWCGGPSTTAPRPPGASGRTSGSRPRSPSAGWGPACGPTTSRRSRGPATWRRSSC